MDDTGVRQACQVTADGKDVQAEIVKLGLAWDWARYSGGKYAALEDKARNAKCGLWVDNRASEIHWGKRER